MKKPRIQPSFASLTEDELEQLACMVQRETFVIVLERVRKPRSEGGFGLTLRSESPLERLLDKKNKLDLINARLCRECADHKKLTLADINSITAGESRAPVGLSGSDVHDAIMGATYILVTEQDNTPHQLLALQRLADFPARAEIRAERHEFARAKEQRATEMHTHKINLDLRKFDHKLHMAEFHKQITTARIAHSTQNSGLRTCARSAQDLNRTDVDLNCPTSISHDAMSYDDATTSIQNAGRGTFQPCPTSISPHAIDLSQPCNADNLSASSRDANTPTNATPADPNATDIQNSSAPATPVNPANPVDHVQKPLTEAEITALIPHVISPRPLPPEVIRANIRYAEKVRTGKIIIDRSGPWVRAVELPDSTDNAETVANSATEQTQPGESI